MTPEFFSQFGEDKWCFENLKFPERGVYVDIGCADASLTSNTCWLRQLGWSGVGIDGNPDWIKYWGDGKDFVCAVLSHFREVRFEIDHAEPWVSRIKNGDAPIVKTRSLEDILAERSIGKIDFLSIDIEGHEYDVLTTLDIGLHQPSIIVTEFSTRGLPDDFRAKELLEGLGYKEAHRTESNLIMVTI